MMIFFMQNMNLFSCGFDVTEGLDVGFHVEYELFSFDPIIPDHLFKLDDNILYVEYKFFSCGFDIHGSYDDGFCVEYESFSFDLLQVDLLFEYCKSEIVKSNNVVTKNVDLNQTLVLFDMTRLVSCAPTILLELLIHDDIVSRTMTSILARFEYIHFLSDWAQLFDKLKRTLTCALLAKWMHSFWLQLTIFHCFYVI